jgi:uncharacterized membrane protein
VSKKKWKIGIFLGIVLITITSSLITLPLLMDENNTNNSFQESFSKLKSSENKMLDFVQQEKNELATRMNQLNEDP